MDIVKYIICSAPHTITLAVYDLGTRCETLKVEAPQPRIEHTHKMKAPCNSKLLFQEPSVYLIFLVTKLI